MPTIYLMGLDNEPVEATQKLAKCSGSIQYVNRMYNEDEYYTITLPKVNRFILNHIFNWAEYCKCSSDSSTPDCSQTDDMKTVINGLVTSDKDTLTNLWCATSKLNMSCLSAIIIGEMRSDKIWIRISNINSNKHDFFQYINTTFGDIYQYEGVIEFKNGHEFFKDSSIKIEMDTPAALKLIGKAYVYPGTYAPPNSISSEQSSESSSEENSSPDPITYTNRDSLLLDMEVKLSDFAEHDDQPTHFSLRHDQNANNSN